MAHYPKEAKKDFELGELLALLKSPLEEDPDSSKFFTCQESFSQEDLDLSFNKSIISKKEEEEEEEEQESSFFYSIEESPLEEDTSPQHEIEVNQVLYIHLANLYVKSWIVALICLHSSYLF